MTTRITAAKETKLSGVITSGPFEILHAEKYKSYHNRVQQGEASFNYEDPPIPKLSEECKRLGEGGITLEECSKDLNSFALIKVPGNDGLPVEFYLNFWDQVGELLVDCFNESFLNGEMSPSQRQVVITLIEKKVQDRCDLKNSLKSITERLKRILPDLLNENQSIRIHSG